MYKSTTTAEKVSQSPCECLQTHENGGTSRLAAQFAGNWLVLLLLLMAVANAVLDVGIGAFLRTP
jgi:hypothetical protein